MSSELKHSDHLLDIDVVPEPDSDAMVDLLYRSLGFLIENVPVTFTIGDLMAALLYHVVETAMQGSEPERVTSDIADAVERIKAQIGPSVPKRMN